LLAKQHRVEHGQGVTSFTALPTFAPAPRITCAQFAQMGRLAATSVTRKPAACATARSAAGLHPHQALSAASPSWTEGLVSRPPATPQPSTPQPDTKNDHDRGAALATSPATNASAVTRARANGGRHLLGRAGQRPWLGLSRSSPVVVST
jgi:hypothetical protein